MFESSNPKMPYFVANQMTIFPNHLKVLIKLYQPIIGNTALALFQTLVQNFDSYEMLADAQPLYLLQEQLDCSLQTFFQALHRLEAVGLVKTFLQHNVHGDVLVFSVQQVPSASAFFATSLLASLLKEKLGTVTFQRLSHQFSQEARTHRKKVTNLQEVSANFFEVFRLPSDEAINPSTEVVTAAHDNQVGPTQIAKISQSKTYDWAFLTELFQRYQITADEVQTKKADLASLMSSYGLSEQELVDEILPTLHGNHKLDLVQIKRALAVNYRATTSQRAVKAQLAANAQQPAGNKLQQQDQTLLTEVRQYAPIAYLYHLREQRGGRVTSFEKSLVLDLNSVWGFSDEVINLLLHTALANNSTLNRKFVEAIANSWIQNGVATGQQALNYLAKRQQKKQQPRQRRKRLERGTDWSKKRAEITTKDDPKALEAIFKQFKDQEG
ncbi:MAG: DnaD domain protein [Lactobacillus sp.]